MAPEQSVHVTRLLHNWVQGDEKALGALIPVVHRELRRLAHQQLRAERSDHTLQSTALVNEAFMRLLGSQPPELRNRAHFLSIASRLMRQILVDYSRTRQANKRDAGIRLPFEAAASVSSDKDKELGALDDALNDLAMIDERQAKIVELKFFGGLSSPEISEVMGLSRATVDREWATARAWLHRSMSRTGSP
jgi:RNA polymerase sigma factor (TIGR02999 family)